jgi:hypothetical protein
MRFESDFEADFPLSLGAHTAFVVLAVKFITALKLSLKRGQYVNLSSRLADSRY